MESAEQELLAKIGDSIIGRASGRLMKAVSSAIDSAGHEGAVYYCAGHAAGLTQLGLAPGWQLGRISLRNRNPGNKAGNADAHILKDMAKQGGAKTAVHRVVQDTVHYYKPIVLAAACLACHGNPDQVAPKVAAAIKERYPHDQALGYKEGDMRGAWKLSVLRETLVNLHSK